MSDSFNVTFPGGVAVDATFRGHTLHTDQPFAAGGANTALSPFDAFLGSIAACMGFYALRFCQERQLSTEGLGLELTPVRNAASKRLETVRISLTTPQSFPEKYRDALVRSVEHCAVKRVLLDPPQFDFSVRTPELMVAG